VIARGQTKKNQNKEPPLLVLSWKTHADTSFFVVRLAARCKQRQSERGGGGCERKTDRKKEVQC
jgi:hypothetical protein